MPAPQAEIPEGSEYHQLLPIKGLMMARLTHHVRLSHSTLTQHDFTLTFCIKVEVRWSKKTIPPVVGGKK